MSVVEDICSASTQEMWLMPKHIVLGMTVRHLSGRADLITILNRYRHCQSYAKLMELDTALADQVVDSGSLLPSNISVSANVSSLQGQLWPEWRDANRCRNDTHYSWHCHPGSGVICCGTVAMQWPATNPGVSFSVSSNMAASMLCHMSCGAYTGQRQWCLDRTAEQWHYPVSTRFVVGYLPWSVQQHMQCSRLGWTWRPLLMT